MTPTLAVRVLAVTVLAVGASAQQQDSKFTLGGTVTNSQTGEPIKRALVTLDSFSAPRAPASRDAIGRLRPSPPPLVGTAFTDAAGSFRFDNLAAGDYSASARKAG